MVMVSFECIVSLSKVRINKYFFMITKTGTLGVPGDCDNPALVALAWADKVWRLISWNNVSPGEVRGARVSTPGSHQGRSRLVSRHVRIRNISSSSKDREELAIWVSSSAVSR